MQPMTVLPNQVKPELGKKENSLKTGEILLWEIKMLGVMGTSSHDQIQLQGKKFVFKTHL
jgi:hypothetical protein